MILGALAPNSSEAYWMPSVIKVAVVRAVSPTVRDSFQLKWKSMGCSSVDYVVSKTLTVGTETLNPSPLQRATAKNP